MAKKPTRESRLVQRMSKNVEVKNPIASEMFLPNHSGDVKAPSLPGDLVNKAYVDAEVAGMVLDVKFAAINAGISGDNTLVAAVTGKKIRVISLSLVVGDDVETRFESGAGGTAITGDMDLAANSGLVLPYNPAGWFETAAGALLNLELGGAVEASGSLTYIEV